MNCLPPHPTPLANVFVKRRGFALVIALALMGFILLLLLSLTVFVRVETSAASSNQDRLEARLNALLALQVAVGSLQKSVGTDTRITGQAELEPNDGDPDLDQLRWTGVWTEAIPDDRGSNPRLLTWLVSGNEGYTLANDGTPSPPAFDPWTEIEERVVLARLTSGHAAVEAPEVRISARGKYAYWIRDEGTRARVNRHAEDLGSSGPRERMMRRERQNSLYQSGVSSIDGLETFPALPGFNIHINEATRPSEFKLWAGSLFEDEERTADLSDAWSFWSRGVQANARDGGLKKDLSLAFELPLDDFNAIESFNEARITLNNYTYDVGYTYMEPIGTQFVRGPTWQLLRDYHQLYREMEDNASAPMLKARAVFPNIEEVYASGDSNRIDERNLVHTYNLNMDVFRMEQVYNASIMQLVPLVRPTGNQITPYLQRVLLFVSFQKLPGSEPGSNHMAIVVDPVVVLWNPFNVRLEVPALKIRMRNFELRYTVDIQRGGTAPSDAPDYYAGPYNMRRASLFNNQGTDETAEQNFLYFVATSEGTSSTSQPPLIFEPGEMLFFSMTNNSPQPLNTNLYASPGFNINGGAYYENIVSTGQHAGYEPLVFWPEGEVDGEFTDGDEVTINFEIFSGNFYFATYLVEQDRIAATNETTNWQHLLDPEIQEVEINPFFVTNQLDDNAPINTQTESKQNVATLDFHINPLGTNDRSFPLLASHSFTAPAAFNRLSNNNQRDLLVGFWNADVNNTAGFLPPTGLQTVGASGQATTWGATFASEGAGGQRFAPLLPVPTVPPQSIADLSGASVAISPYQPTFAIGNSLPSPLIARNQVLDSGNGPRTHHDLSYLLNEALWDDYFFSTISPLPLDNGNYPQTDVGVRGAIENRIESFLNGVALPNPRVRPASSRSDFAAIESDLKAADAYRRSAGHLVVDGSFNINSLSVDAWTSFLGMLPDHAREIFDPNTGSLDTIQRSNSLTSSDLPSGPDDAPWRGFRSMENGQIGSLAAAIVEQIRERGPFTSLGDFVNRSLATNDNGLAGALQAAIDASGINDDNKFSIADTLAQKQDQFPHLAHLRERTGFGIPGYVTQADLLRAIGPYLSVRSDTFTIRTVGIVRNQAGREITRAYCEAVVQRLPHYVDAVDAPWETPSEAVNETFGRRFEIVDFRWIEKDEI